TSLSVKKRFQSPVIISFKESTGGWVHTGVTWPSWSTNCPDSSTVFPFNSLKSWSFPKCSSHSCRSFSNIFFTLLFFQFIMEVMFRKKICHGELSQGKTREKSVASMVDWRQSEA